MHGARHNRKHCYYLCLDRIYIVDGVTPMDKVSETFIYYDNNSKYTVIEQ